jgi:hypothetical protein
MEINKTDRIEIPLSKVKLTLMLIAAIAFVAIGFYLVIYQRVSPIFRSHIFNTTASIAGILFFGIGAFFILLKLKDNRPGIIIDKKGLDINASAASFGLVKWDEIEDVKAVKYQNQDLLLILVKNPEEYIGIQKNMIVRKAMELSWKYLNTPITISANGLKCNFDQLKNIVQAKYKENCGLKDS